MNNCPILCVIFAECRVFVFIYCNAQCHCAECLYADCHYAECRGADKGGGVESGCWETGVGGGQSGKRFYVVSGCPK
jgi:hypothetical protein